MAHIIVLANGQVNVKENTNISQNEWKDISHEDGVEVALLIENQRDLDDAREMSSTPGCEGYDFAAIRSAANKIKNFPA